MAAAGEEVTSGLPFQSGTVSPAGHGAGGSVGASLLVKLGPQQREWSRPHSSKLEPYAWSLLELFCRPRERLVRLLHLPGWLGLLLKEVGAFRFVPPLESSCSLREIYREIFLGWPGLPPIEVGASYLAPPP